MFDVKVRALPSSRFLRFLIAGGLNTLFGFAVYSAAVIFGSPAWIALLASTIAGILFNFVTTSSYVFRDLTLSRLPRFIFCYVAVYAVNLVLLNWITRWIDSRILSQAVLAFPMAVFAYGLMVRIAFKPKAFKPGSFK